MVSYCKEGCFRQDMQLSVRIFYNIRNSSLELRCLTNAECLVSICRLRRNPHWRLSVVLGMKLTSTEEFKFFNELITAIYQ